MMIIDLPAEVCEIIDKLCEHGYAAYAVGGGVRDAVRGAEPSDWDIATDAAPDEIIACFEGHRIIETGIAHGTVTIRMGGKSFEVTTFRVDGEYLDARRPDSVEFVDDIRADLARRDFTMNAIAYNGGIVDPFGGCEDIARGVIRCVGDAEARFGEDALRIMRALRFAATLGFEIEDEARTALRRAAPRLREISVERIASELNKLLVGENVLPVLAEYREVFAEIIPELEPMFDFAQNNSFHIYDVWGHTIHAVAAAPQELTVRLTMLLHDIGKPHCYTESDGRGHFYGHEQISEKISRDVLQRLKYPRAMTDEVVQLIANHSIATRPEPRIIRRRLNELGVERLKRLFNVKRSDARAKSPEMQAEQLARFDESERLVDEILAQSQCFSLNDLAICGDDLVALGLSGRKIGETLAMLLDRVIEGEIPNEREALLAEVL